MEITNQNHYDGKIDEFQLEEIVDSFLSDAFKEVRIGVYRILEQMGVTLKLGDDADDTELVDMGQVEEYLKEQNGQS